MKKVLALVMCLGVFAGCNRGVDLYEAPVDKPENTNNENKLEEQAEKVFGVVFDENQDWCSTTSGEVTVQVNASVKKVQLLVEVCEVTEDCASYVTRNSLKVLNEAYVNGQSSIKLSYDAPKDYVALFVAFITDSDYLVKKVEGTTVSVDDVAQARTRTLSTNYVLSVGDFKIQDIHPSYAAERGWVPNEKLYDLSVSDYSQLKMESTPYSSEFLTIFNSFVFSTFPNGREYNNLPKVKSTGFYNANSYAITTGDEPIIVTPVYKCDNPAKYGNEVYNSELYYYYFKDADLANLENNDTVAFLQSLPKYKAIPLNQCFAMDGDDNFVKKYGSFALLYFGDGTPSVGTKGSFQFEPGYRIGFMVRANTEWDEGRKKGEVYCDGRLNREINTSDDFNFKSSGLKVGDPRAAWLSINKKMLLCWESGTDKDFNDIIMEVEGGIEGPTPPPTPEKNTYTFCFEDTKNGDFDMNDVVIKAVREDATTVRYSIVACGAYDELYIHGITDELAQKEVHTLFNKQLKQFANTTESDAKDEIYSFTVTVSEDFSFLTDLQPWIEDRTTGENVALAKAGQNPHGIMIPYDFRYPLEKVCITKAYPYFNNWGTNPVTSTLWYMSPTLSKVYTK